MDSGVLISQSDKRPIYLQIIEQIKRRIAVGDWTEGQPIPSIRQLAVDLQVSVITVKRAYLELEREGVIVTQQGRGSRVASDSRPRNTAASGRTAETSGSRPSGCRLSSESNPKNWKAAFAKPATTSLQRKRNDGSRYQARRRGQEVSLLHARQHSSGGSRPGKSWD